jgi:hypothetical protein
VGGAVFAQQVQASLGVDHRVRPTPGELLLAEVEALVGTGRRRQAPRLRDRRVRPHLPEDGPEDHL